MYLKMGYATLAINELKTILKNYNKSKIRLWTQEYNKKAQQCFINNGFNIVGKEFGEVNGGERVEEFIIMECEL